MQRGRCFKDGNMVKGVVMCEEEDEVAMVLWCSGSWWQSEDGAATCRWPRRRRTIEKVRRGGRLKRFKIKSDGNDAV